MNSNPLIDAISVKLDSLGVPYKKRENADLVILAAFLDAENMVGENKITYESSVFADERAGVVYFWEMMSERHSGISFNSDDDSGFQTSRKLHKKVKNTNPAIPGFDLGLIAEIVSDVAKQFGWDFKTVLKESKAQYPQGYIPSALMASETPAASDAASIPVTPVAETAAAAATFAAAPIVPNSVRNDQDQSHQTVPPPIVPQPIVQAVPVKPKSSSAVILYAVVALVIIGAIVFAVSALIGKPKNNDPAGSNKSGSTQSTVAGIDSSIVSQGVSTDDLGNIINGQYYFSDGSSIYYSSFDTNNAAHMYKANPDGSGAVSIFNGFGWSIVVKDDWVYFSGNAGTKIDASYNLFRMKKDGTGITTLNTSMCYGMFFYKNWIYYIKKSSYTATDYALCRANPDGTGEQVITSDINGYGIVFENKLYFSGKDNLMYQAEPDGSNRKAILSESVKYSIIGNGKIIYLDLTGNIKTANIDGTGVKTVRPVSTGTMYSINSYKDTIFFTEYDTTAVEGRYAYNYRVHSVAFGGGSEKTIYTGISYGFYVNIVNNKVYVLDYAIDTATGAMPAIARSMNLDGSGVKDLIR